MKKLICMLLAMLLVFALVACGSETTSEPEKRDDTVKTTEGAKITDDEADKVPAETTVIEDTAEAELKDGDPIIISVSVYHGDGEVTENRIAANKGDILYDILRERTYITEDMLTVDGERAYPERGSTWSLYIDGMFTTESWDTIAVDNGVEYTFEYTIEMEMEGEPGTEEGAQVEDGAQENHTEEDVGEPDAGDTGAEEIPEDI